MKILWLKTGPLHPLDTGGKIRTYNMLRELARKHHLTYLSLCPPGADPVCLQNAREYSQEQIWIRWSETRKGSVRFFAELAANLVSPLPYVLAKYRSEEMSQRIQDSESAGKHDLIICDFLTPWVNLNRVKLRPNTRTVLFQHNVESLIWKRLFDNARGVKRLYFYQQWQRLERFERRACAQASAVVGVSEDDCQIMRDRFGLKNVIGAVPTGVDVDYFASALPGQKKPLSLVFLGSMDWMPNIDGIDWFVQHILPLVRQRFPEVTLSIVGRNPPAQIKAMEKAIPGICVTGTVPDVRPFLAEGQIMIVPLRIGGGTRIKIFEGMAAGLPVVSTAIGAEGLPLKDGEHLYLADTPDLFGKRICQLLEQAPLRQRLAEQGRSLVCAQFSWKAATELFERYCTVACKGVAF